MRFLTKKLTIFCCKGDKQRANRLNNMNISNLDILRAGLKVYEERRNLTFEGRFRD